MKKKAFSLAEMIVTLLILSIIMAASAPLITKRQKLNNMFDCFWQENNQLEGSLSFAQGGQGTVGIGIKPENKDYILHLRSSDSANARNIAFYETNSNLVGSLGFYGNNIYFGDGDIEGENNVVIGKSNESVNGNKLFVGPLTYVAPLIFGDFDETYVQINGCFKVNDSLFVQGEGNFDSITANDIQTESLSIANEITNLQVSNLTVGKIISDIFQLGGDSENTISDIWIKNSILTESSMQNITYTGEQDFSESTVKGLKCDLTSGVISSDKRLKEVIGETKVGLEELRKVEIKDYKWKDKRDKGILHTGVIAQELQKIFPNLVIEDKDGYLKIKPIELIFIVIKAIKELDKELQDLKGGLSLPIRFIEYKNLVEENSRLKSEIADLKRKDEKLEKQIEKISRSVEKLEAEAKLNLQ